MKSLLKSPLGLCVIGGGVVLLILLVFLLFSPEQKRPVEKTIAGKEWKKTDSQNFDASVPTYESMKDKPPEAIPAKGAEEQRRQENRAVAAQRNDPQNGSASPPRPPLPSTSLNVYAVPNKASSEADFETMLASKKLVPFGRMIRCVLINAAESINLETPVIGLVLEDLVWDGKVIIPMGTEVHGMVKGVQQRDRLGCAQDWVLVLKEPKFRNRRELMLQALILDSDVSEDKQTFGVTDGSAGLKGLVIDSTQSKEFKLFMAAFLSGVANTSQQTNTTAFGTTNVMPNARNAALSGVGEVIDEYADKIQRAIERDGLYVRVSAGKEFYLYVKQPIDLDQAKIGNTTLQQFIKSQPPTKR